MKYSLILAVAVLVAVCTLQASAWFSAGIRGPFGGGIGIGWGGMRPWGGYGGYYGRPWGGYYGGYGGYGYGWGGYAFNEKDSDAVSVYDEEVSSNNNVAIINNEENSSSSDDNIVPVSVIAAQLLEDGELDSETANAVRDVLEKENESVMTLELVDRLMSTLERIADESITDMQASSDAVNTLLGLDVEDEDSSNNDNEDDDSSNDHDDDSNNE